jgi:glutaredoxin-like protein NrdH
MNESLTVYELPGCVQCRMTERALDASGLPYRVVNLAEDETAVEYVKDLGYSSAPVVVVGTASWSGFRPDLIATVATARGKAVSR